MTEYVVLGSAVALVLFTFLCLFRVVGGPTVLDRIVGVNVVGAKTTVLLVLIGHIFGNVSMFVDIAIAYAMLNFILFPSGLQNFSFAAKSPVPTAGKGNPDKGNYRDMSLLGSFLLILGVFFFGIGAIGILRFPDFYSRLHAAGKCDVLATTLALTAVALFNIQDFSWSSLTTWDNVRESLKILTIIVFVYVATPHGYPCHYQGGYHRRH